MKQIYFNYKKVWKFYVFLDRFGNVKGRKHFRRSDPIHAGACSVCYSIGSAGTSPFSLKCPKFPVCEFVRVKRKTRKAHASSHMEVCMKLTKCRKHIAFISFLSFLSLDIFILTPRNSCALLMVSFYILGSSIFFFLFRSEETCMEARA